MNENMLTMKSFYRTIVITNIVWLMIIGVLTAMLAHRDEQVARSSADKAVNAKVAEMCNEVKAAVFPMYDDLGIQYDPNTTQLVDVLRPLLQLAQPFDGEGSGRNKPDMERRE